MPLLARVELLAAVMATALAGALLSPSPSQAQSTGLGEVRALIYDEKYAQAEQRAKLEIQRAEAAHGPESLEVAELLDELAEAMRFGGKAGTPEAREAAERAVRIKEKAVGPEDARYAASLYQLAYLYFVNSDFAQAKPLFERALAIRETSLGKDHADVATTLVPLAAVIAEAGDLAAAEPLLKRALAIRVTALGPDDPYVAECLNALAGVLLKRGDFSAAGPMYEEALRIWEAAWGKDATATCLNNLAAVRYLTGDYSGALAYHRRALDIRTRKTGPNHELVARVLVGIGMDLAALGRITESREYYQQAIAIQESRFGRGSPEVGKTLSSLGSLYLQSGDNVNAKLVLERAAADLERGLGGDHPDLAEALAALATATSATGDPAAAARMYERALSIQERSLGADHPDVGLMLTRYARTLAASGKDSTALEVAMRGEEISRAHLRLTCRSLPEHQALSYAAARPSGGRVALSILANGLGMPSSAIARNWDSLIRGRVIVLDEMASRNRTVALAADSATLRLGEDLTAARRRLANLLVAGPRGQSPERYRAAVNGAREEAEHAERALAAKSAAFRLEQERSQIGLREVRAALPPGGALLAYATAGDSANLSYVAFLLVEGDSMPVFVAFGRASTIDARVSSWLGDVSRSGSSGILGGRRAETASRASGAALRRLIWDPVAQRLHGARRIFVVPDGAINLVNFAAFPAGRDEYLVEGGLVFQYLSAERDLVRDPTIVPHGTGLLVMGNPAFDSRAKPASPGYARGPADRGAPAGETVAYRGAEPDCPDFRSISFPPLPGTGREVRDVAAVWPHPDQTIVLSGAAATEAAFKARAPGREVIHLATHGFFLGDCRPGTDDTRGIGKTTPAQARTQSQAPRDENPLMLSGLALAGANQRATAKPDQEDGILTAEEIATLNLTGVEWAVLSACDTGKGKIQAGEGVLGLRRAFQIAGARTVIMSLWAVEDESARLWMKALYENRFVERFDTADAVAKASLSVLRERRAQARSTDPFYWAAFVAAGDWE